MIPLTGALSLFSVAPVYHVLSVALVFCLAIRLIKH